MDVDTQRTDGQGREESTDSVDENGMYLWQRRNKELKDRPFGSMALYKNGEECLEIWTSAYQRDSKKQSEPGMNKLAKGIPEEFADVALDWHGRKWEQKSGEWNFWYWINNC